MKMIATNIIWDTDGEDVKLPKMVEIPKDVIPDDVDINEYVNSYAEEVEDWLSDTYGFCVYHFNLIIK